MKNYFLSSNSHISAVPPVLGGLYLKEKSKALASYTKCLLPPNKTIPPQASITQNHVKKVYEWLRELGLSDCIHYKDSHFLQDPFRNGYILGEILKKLGYDINNDPGIRNIDTVTAHLTTCIATIKDIPGCSIDKLSADSIMLGNEEFIFGLIYNLSLLLNNFPKKKSNLYNDYQREDLLHSLYFWVKGLKVVRNLENCPDLSLLSTVRHKDVLSQLFNRVVGNSITNKDNIIDALQRKMRLNELSDSSLLDNDILLFILENLHRIYDNLEILTCRTYSLPIYTGKGYRGA